MEYRILGPLEVVSEGTAPDLGAPKQRAVLAILLLQAGEIVSADRLVELVWGSNPPRTAAHSVQIYVSALRKVLDPLAGRPVIATRATGYVLEADPETIDARRFERLVADGTSALEAGDHVRGAETLRAALALWRGAPLADFAYEEFAQPHIRRLSGVRLDALEHLAAAELSRGRDAEAVAFAESVAAEDPLRERARELQMVALYRAGRAPEALRVYGTFRRLLADELGLDPSPALRRLEKRILLHDPTLGVLTWLGNRPPEVVLVSYVSGSPITRSVVAGFEEAATEFGLRTESTFTAEEEFMREIRLASEAGAGLVVTVTGDCHRAVEPAAREHSEIRYAAFDCLGSLPNVAYVTFAAEEGSFLAGAAAAMKSDTGMIGFVGGVDKPLIRSFQAGFEAGARAVDPDIEIRSAFLTELPDQSGFHSPTLGFQAAERMYQDGVDIVFPAAGGSGQGVMEAALQLSDAVGRHLWTIGVDVDAYRLLDPGDPWRPHILTSMVKRYDRVAYALVAEYARVEFRTGNRAFDLAAEGVDIAYSGGFLDDVRPQIEDLRARVISGEIDVPSSVPGG